MIAEPVMHLATCRNGVDVAEPWRKFVTYDEIGLVAGDRITAHQQIIVDGRCQRLSQQHAALQVVDVVVHRRHQVDDTRDNAGGFIAYLDAHSFGSNKNVLPLQEVQRAAGAAEFLARADRSRLRGKYVGRQLLLAKFSGGIGLKVEIRAVQATVDLRQLVVHIADLEIAPLAEVITSAETNEEFAHTRCHFLDGTVVTESRVVIVRVDAAEQRIRRFLHEVGEQILKRTLTRIGAGHQFPLLTKFAIDEKCQAAIEVGFEIVVSIFALQQFSRAVDRALGIGHVGHADVEPVILFELQVAQVQFSATIRVHDRNFDRVRAFRQDFLADETARLIDRDRPASNPDLVIIRNTRSAHIDGATREPNVVQSKSVLTVCLQQRQIRLSVSLLRRDGVRRLCLVVDHPQRLRSGLVEIAVRAVGAQYVTQLIVTGLKFLSLRQPFCRALDVDRDNVERFRLRRAARFQDANFGAIYER